MIPSNTLSKCYLVRGVYKDENGELDNVHLLVRLNSRWRAVTLSCQPGRGNPPRKDPWGLKCYRYRRFRKGGHTFIGFKEPPPEFLKPLLCPGKEWSLRVETHPSRVQHAVREWTRQVNAIHGDRKHG